MTASTICHAAAGMALHLHYALTGLVVTPSGVPEIAPQFHRSI